LIPGHSTMDVTQRDYSSVHMQIDPFDWTAIEPVRAKTRCRFQAVRSVGDAVFVRANND